MGQGHCRQPFGTSSAIPYGSTSEGIGAILFGTILKMAEVNRATRGCRPTVKCCLCGNVKPVLLCAI